MQFPAFWFMAGIQPAAGGERDGPDGLGRGRLVCGDHAGVAASRSRATHWSFCHEMGHLRLPYGSHAASGIMKAGCDTQQARLASTHSLTFEPRQAALIRARLQAASMSR